MFKTRPLHNMICSWWGNKSWSGEWWSMKDSKIGRRRRRMMGGNLIPDDLRLWVSDWILFRFPRDRHCCSLLGLSCPKLPEIGEPSPESIPMRILSYILWTSEVWHQISYDQMNHCTIVSTSVTPEYTSFLPYLIIGRDLSRCMYRITNSQSCLSV